MTSIPPISPLGMVPPISPTAPVASTGATGGADFGNVLTRGVDALQKTQASADGLATQAATGSLDDITRYMVASTSASIATQLTTAVRDKAVAAFTSIMNMQM